MYVPDVYDENGNDREGVVGLNRQMEFDEEDEDTLNQNEIFHTKVDENPNETDDDEEEDGMRDVPLSDGVTQVKNTIQS